MSFAAVSGVTARRVLHITTFLQGGAGRVVADLACAQRQAGMAVAVACAAEELPGYEHYPAWRDQLSDAGVPVIPVHCTFRRTLPHLMGAVADLERTMFVRAGVDLVHAHAAVPALVARAFSRRVPVLATMHGWNAAKSAEHAATDVAIYNGLPTIVVPSTAAAEHLCEAGVDRERLVVVPYGVAPQAARGLTADAGEVLAPWRAAGRLVVVCVGSVGIRKRQTDLVDALDDPQLRDGLGCAFLGEGPDLDRLRCDVAARGLGDAVRFLGRRENVTDWLRAADLVVFPSSREGLPVALLEAAALGCAVVVSDIDEHCAVVSTDISGVVFRVGDPVSLAEVLRRAVALGGAGRRALGSALQRVWSSTYRPETMRARYAELYAAALVEDALPAARRCP